MINRIRLLVMIKIAFFSYSSSVEAGGFFSRSNQYKGFYWFETYEKQRQNEVSKSQYQIPTPAEAEVIINARRKRMDDARNQMIAVGLDENAPMEAKRQAIIAYKKLEIPMWDGAISMVEASDMGNFINPELLNGIEQPTNVFGIKLKRKMDAEKDKLTILEFAQDFDLLLFTENSCPYCKEFKPVVNSFASEYQFKLDVTSLDSKAGEIAKKLGITAIPTLVVVKKDGSQLFELSRGMVSLSDLGRSVMLAARYSMELGQKSVKRRGVR